MTRIVCPCTLPAPPPMREVSGSGKVVPEWAQLGVTRFFVKKKQKKNEKKQNRLRIKSCVSGRLEMFCGFVLAREDMSELKRSFPVCFRNLWRVFGNVWMYFEESVRVISHPNLTPYIRFLYNPLIFAKIAARTPANNYWGVPKNIS